MEGFDRYLQKVAGVDFFREIKRINKVSALPRPVSRDLFISQKEDFERKITLKNQYVKTDRRLCDR